MKTVEKHALAASSAGNGRDVAAYRKLVTAHVLAVLQVRLGKTPRTAGGVFTEIPVDSERDIFILDVDASLVR